MAVQKMFQVRQSQKRREPFLKAKIEHVFWGSSNSFPLESKRLIRDGG
jgi:hypothetical protein